MGNSCMNRVLFTGDPVKVKGVKALFRQIEDKQQKEEIYHLPSYLVATNAYMWNIEFGNQRLYYYTKTLPNLEALKQIADNYGIGFANQYEELENNIYGEAIYKDSVFTDFRLNRGDFNSYHYDLKAGIYLYDGKSYENEEEIIELLLEKKKSLLTPKTLNPLTEQPDFSADQSFLSR
jgi:hypothetical protein